MAATPSRRGADATASAALLHGSWDPIGYTKAADKKPRPTRPPPKRLHGGHSSVQRLLEGKAVVVES